MTSCMRPHPPEAIDDMELYSVLVNVVIRSWRLYVGRHGLNKLMFTYIISHQNPMEGMAGMRPESLPATIVYTLVCSRFFVVSLCSLVELASGITSCNSLRVKLCPVSWPEKNSRHLSMSSPTRDRMMSRCLRLWSQHVEASCHEAIPSYSFHPTLTPSNPFSAACPSRPQTEARAYSP